MSFLNSVLNTIDNKSGAKPQPPPPLQIRKPPLDVAKKPGANGVKPTSISTPTASSPATPLPGATAKAVPKKGSFADILARGKQNQGIAVGQIAHKPVQQLKAKSKETLSAKAGSKHKPGDVKKGHGQGQNDRGREEVLAPMKGAGVNKRGVAAPNAPPVKKRPQPEYQGTIRVKPSSAKPVSGAARGGVQKSTPGKAGRNRYDEDDDMDMDEDEDSEQGYDDDSSDMDAGFDDVEEEDARALVMAKKEDAAQERLLQEMARQKEARKKREALQRQRERERGW